MHITITTATGSIYRIDDTAVTRQSGHEVQGAGLPGYGSGTLCTWTSPTVGVPWRFSTVDGPVITSPVTGVQVAAFLG